MDAAEELEKTMSPEPESVDEQVRGVEVRGGDRPEDYFPEWEEDTQSWAMKLRPVSDAE